MPAEASFHGIRKGWSCALAGAIQPRQTRKTLSMRLAIPKTLAIAGKWKSTFRPRGAVSLRPNRAYEKGSVERRFRFHDQEVSQG